MGTPRTAATLHARTIGPPTDRARVQPRGEVLLKGKSMPTKLFVPSYRPFRVAIKYC